MIDIDWYSREAIVALGLSTVVSVSAGFSPVVYLCRPSVGGDKLILISQTPGNSRQLNIPPQLHPRSTSLIQTDRKTVLLKPD